VPNPVCVALGPTLRQEREPPPGVLHRLQGHQNDALRRLVTFDEASKSGWRRLDLSSSDGTIRLESIAFGNADVADALSVVAALIDTPLVEPTEQGVEPRAPRAAMRCV
jgi:hypothetical protein